ncbi:MAG: Hsp20/alpha crystallin family protein [Candidatus Fimisoma sp.]
MLMPSIFGENLFDDFMDDFMMNRGARSVQNVMKTDIKETDDSYELKIEMPGYRKEDVKAQLKDGYLTISAETDNSSEEKNEEGKYIRRERYTGAVSRSFFVGKDLTEEDIKARFENGILHIALPKEAPKKIEENKYIAIEG